MAVIRPEIQLNFAPELHIFVDARRRIGPTVVITDGVSTLGHVVESLGVPLTEVGGLLVDGQAVPNAHVPAAGESVEVRPVSRPQRVEGAPLRFLLDVHLGTLARRMRLLGIDTAYESTDIGDPALAARSAAERRVLLSRDRGLLRRRELWAGAYVYSTHPEQQLREVLERFAPELAPWERCVSCNGDLVKTTKESIRTEIKDGTEHAYDAFAKCTGCGQVYWQGAHHARLELIVTQAQQITAAANARR
ncbi:Mut7-C RNAse domain-containing protein [Actinocorallia libanotica]|uniref:Mut7-C RNAse domain-containing protein n=2 Tax=Actinocorallia libanotica TaxID=46162 RepID=A0ABN1RG64_9ACTN